MTQRWATLYTDASWSDETGGGWAVWARSDFGRIVRAGTCPDYVVNSSEAELSAIFAGLYLVVQFWPEVDSVLVRSDCVDALETCEKAQPPRNPGARRLWRRVRRLLDESSLCVRTKWVKGHVNPKVSTRAFLNDQCDKLAREARLGAKLAL